MRRGRMAAGFNERRRPGARPGRRSSSVVLAARSALAQLGVVDLDLLLANVAADGLLVSDGLLADPDPLDRDGLGVDHWALGVQRDLVLLLRDRGPVVGRATVGGGDGLALQGDLVVADWHGGLLVVGG